MTIKEEKTENINKKPTSNEIEEIKSYIPQFGSKLNLSSSICYCDKAPGPSQNLKPRPHIKAEYCLENDDIKTTVKSSKISEIVQNVSTEDLISPPNNCSSNVSKVTQEKSNPTSAMKQKSIFSFTRPARTNSVVIEELPSEFNNNNANVKTKSNETVANKSKFSAEVANKNMSNKQVRSSDTKNLNKNNEQSNNLNNKCYKMSPRKVEVADKYKNKTSRSEKYSISKVYN